MLLDTRWRFQDEAPRIGCGERGVTIQVGHKWARFTEKATGRTAKLRREIFDLYRVKRLIEPPPPSQAEPEPLDVAPQPPRFRAVGVVENETHEEFDMPKSSKYDRLREMRERSATRRKPKAAKAKARMTDGPSKREIIGKLLKKAKGTTTQEVLEATGWPTVSFQAQAEALGVKLKKRKVQGEPTRYFAA